MNGPVLKTGRHREMPRGFKSYLLRCFTFERKTIETGWTIVLRNPSTSVNYSARLREAKNEQRAPARLRPSQSLEG